VSNGTLDQKLKAIWARYVASRSGGEPPLNARDWSELFRVVQAILKANRSNFDSLYEQLKSSAKDEDDLITSWFVEVLLRRPPAYLNRWSCCKFYKDFLISQTRKRANIEEAESKRDWDDVFPPGREPPGSLPDPSENPLRGDRERDAEVHRRVSAIEHSARELLAVYDEQPWFRLYLAFNFGPRRFPGSAGLAERPVPLTTLRDIYGFGTSYHYYAAQLGVMLKQTKAGFLDGLRGTRLEMWLEEIGIKLHPENEVAVSAALQILCEEALRECRDRCEIPIPDTGDPET